MRGKGSALPAVPPAASATEVEDSVVAVAVDSDKNSHHALKWAADHLIPRSQKFYLLHVRKRMPLHPPDGNYSPIVDNDDDDDGDEESLATVDENDFATKELLLPFQCFCSKKGLQFEEAILDDVDVSRAILNFVIVKMIDKLVVGSSSRNLFTRTFVSDVPYSISKSAPDFCSVYIISKGKVVSVRPALYSPARRPPLEIGNSVNQFHSAKSEPDYRHPVDPSGRFRANNSQSAIPHQARTGYSHEGGGLNENNYSIASCPSPCRISLDRPQNYVPRDYIEREARQYHSPLRHENRGAFCNELKSSYASQSNTSYSNDRISHPSKEYVEASWSRHQMVVGEHSAAKEDFHRVQNTTSSEEKSFVPVIKDADFSPDVRYRRYSVEEIQKATDNFSNALKIGEGGYGPVFKSFLDHTAVAIKILRPDAAQGMKQFQKEVEVLSCIRHPNMVLLMGACPEYGCLVYEYMANGSLEDRLLCRSGTPPMPWRLRFKIASEVATALFFLHQAKPEPLVHRDLKPGNILLDHNYVSKIADVGLARLLPSAQPGSDSMYHMTAAAGTFCYIDPEYQKTGMLGTKSDIYALGIIFLQLITAAPPMGLAHNVERAMESGNLFRMLDQNIHDWPMEETLKFARLGLKCAELRQRDRPDLSSVILPELNQLREFANRQGWSSTRT